jgi:hypothetical protein
MPAALAALSGFLQGFAGTYVPKKQRQEEQQRKNNHELAQSIWEKSMSDPTFEPTPEMQKIFEGAYGKDGAKFLKDAHDKIKASPFFQQLSSPDMGAAQRQAGEGSGIGASGVPLAPEVISQLAQNAPRQWDPAKMADPQNFAALAMTNPHAAAAMLQAQKLRQGQASDALFQQALGGTASGGGLPQGMSITRGGVTLRGQATDEQTYNKAALGAQAKSDVEYGRPPGGGAGAAAAPAPGPTAVLPGEDPAAPHPPAIGDDPPAVYKKRLETWSKQQEQLNAPLKEKAALAIDKDGNPITDDRITYGQLSASGGRLISAKQADLRNSATGKINELLWPFLQVVPLYKGTAGLTGKYIKGTERRIETYLQGNDQLNQVQFLRDNSLAYLRSLRDEKGNGMRGDLVKKAGDSFPQVNDVEQGVKSKVRYWGRIFRGIYKQTNTPEPPEFRQWVAAAEREVGRINPMPNMFTGGPLPPEPAPAAQPTPAGTTAEDRLKAYYAAQRR